MDNLNLGEEAASADAKSSAVIGGLTITEYEGSPRRWHHQTPFNVLRTKDLRLGTMDYGPDTRY